MIFIAIVVFSCRKETTVAPMPPAISNSLPVTVTIDESNLRNPISDMFTGLSYETVYLSESDVLNANNKVLVQLLKNVGPGLLRIGGGSSDRIAWTGKPRNASTGTDSVTTSEIDRLAEFSRAIGWPVMFGLNVVKNDPDAAANEAVYVNSKLADNLYALQVGNEPDVYALNGLRPTGYGTLDYKTEFDNYFSAIRAKLPNALFAGPGPAYNTDWLSPFAEVESANIRLLDAHYYVAGPATDPTINYGVLFSDYLKLNNILGAIKQQAETHHLPYRITECNSIYGGGKPGVSDIFASALWALDFMWTLAVNKGDGVNFHGGNHAVYTPIEMQNGLVTAKPEYYALLAFKYGINSATVIAANTNHSEYRCSAYACVNADGTRNVTLINKDETKNFYCTVETGKVVSSVRIARLTAPGMQATNGVTFGGNSINDDGTFVPTNLERYTVNKKSFSINVPAASAAVVILQ